MFGLSLGHLLILLIVILLFGSKRLPELGSALGRGLRAFKSGLDGQPSPEEIAQTRARLEQELESKKKDDSKV